MNVNLFSSKRMPKDLIILLLLNTIIALLLLGVDFAENFSHSFIYSQLIGLCIFASVRWTCYISRNFSSVIQLLTIFLAITFGALSGTLLAHFILQGELLSFAGFLDHFYLKVLVVSLLCGTVISYLFISQMKIQEIKTLAQEEKLKRLAQEKLAIETELRLLQAQVEPHFLFNTLSNIQSLLATDADLASKMLQNLSDFLRSALALSRMTEVTVKDEMKMLTAYLEIFKIRMGNRLKYTIEFDKQAADVAIPSMLIQPLVENSIKHGLEPSIDGGEISIIVSLKNTLLNIEITDTGKGLADNRTPGVGTTSVLKRIQTLYDNKKATINFEENHPRGLKVRMMLPTA